MEFADYKIMFHVSTLLPFSASDPQQVLRKRHIGNDIVTVIFQAAGSSPFDVTSFRSKYQFVFVVVRKEIGEDEAITYSVTTVRSRDVPAFGPPLPPGNTFTLADVESGVLRKFLLQKIINAENASYGAGLVNRLAVRTRLHMLEVSDVIEEGLVTS